MIWLQFRRLVRALQPEPTGVPAKTRQPVKSCLRQAYNKLTCGHSRRHRHATRDSPKPEHVEWHAVASDADTVGPLSFCGL